MNPKDLPPERPNVRVSAHLPIAALPVGEISCQDRDNVVRNLVTIAGPLATVYETTGGEARVTPLSTGVVGAPVLSLDAVKEHLRIERDVMAEDSYLVMLEK